MIPVRKWKKFLAFCFLFYVGIKVLTDVQDTRDHSYEAKRVFLNLTSSNPISPMYKDHKTLFSTHQVPLSPKNILPKENKTPETDYKNVTNATGNPDDAARDPVFKHKMEKIDKEMLENYLSIRMMQLIKLDNFQRLREINKLLEMPTNPSKPKEKVVNKRTIDNKTSSANDKYKVSHTVDESEISLNAFQIIETSKIINQINSEQKIYNEQKYGSDTDYDTVIIIQIHKRLEHLQFLVESLSKARYIKSCLVVFSHDYYDSAMNNFVQNITAFRLVQIFFPHSIQLHPFEFPGRDPRDCKWNHVPNKKTKNATKCLNEEWPDSYGHYREPSFTQMKHHWWWKLFQIFRGLRNTQTYTGPILFLEEDHYVAPDILHTMHLLKGLENSTAYPNHVVYGLGNYKKVLSKESATVSRGPWDASKFNMGFVLDRRAFNIIKGCSNSYCLYDDYNFDWTIVDMVNTCAKDKLNMFRLTLSRVYHFGFCGTHVHSKSCNVKYNVGLIQKRIQSVEPKLFPTALKIVDVKTKERKKGKSNGGWGDFRDKMLCLAIAKGEDTS